MQESTKPLLIIIAGPTAVGKTHTAVRLAGELDTAVINCDSRQVYREMHIGTALPTEDERKAVPHYFLAHRSIFEGYDASIYEAEVIAFLDEWFKSSNVIVMSGGSGLYIDAVYKGIDDLPSVDSGLRRRLKKEYEDKPQEILERLKNADPDYYRVVDVNNPRRILKALEVLEMTGKSYSSFLTRKDKERNFRTILIGLDIPRQELHERINRRADRMMADGLLSEAKSLLPYKHLNALNTVGYKELFDFFDGKFSLEEAVERIKAHSRQYARRQLTWFRRYPEMKWFHPDNFDSILNSIK